MQVAQQQMAHILKVPMPMNGNLPTKESYLDQ